MAALESIGNSLVAVWKVSRGKLFGIGASACVTLMFTCVKYTKVTPLVAFFYRCTGAFLVLLCISIFSCGYGLFRQLSSHWKLLLLRSLCDGSAAGCFYWSMAFFPLTELGFLLQTQAVFTMIVAFIILREKPTLFQLGCALGAMTGAFLVIQPPVFGFAEKKISDDLSEETADSSGIRFYFGVAVFLSGMISFAFGGTLMRMISLSGQIHWAVAAMLQAFVGCMFSLLALSLSGSLHLLFTVCAINVKLAFIFIVLFSMGLQFCFFFSLKYEKITLLPILLTTQVVFMPIADFALYHTLPNFNPLHYSGFLLILLSVLSLFVAKHLAVTSQERDNKKAKKSAIVLEDIEGSEHSKTST